ncbi:FtsX-like permease family protein [Candidatus Pacearchaeota archaeon]|nr:FtsX-like permease family protein [Candidatus Pacearchaeota archaeon]
MLKDYVNFSINGIRKRRLRSFLTMIGIFIGIAAVVSLISLGQGLEAAIEEQFNILGGDKIMVIPGSSLIGGGAFSADGLTEEDLELVKKVSGVEDATEMYYKIGRVRFDDETKSSFVIGMPTDSSAEIMTELQGFEVEKGRDIRNGDKYKATVGWRIWNDDFFEDSVELRDKIKVEDVEFEVIGLFKKIGNPQDDANVYILLETAREIFNEKKEISTIFVQVQEGEDPEEVAEEIKEEMRKDRDLEEGEENFQVQTFENIMNSFNQIFGIVQAIIIGIASISLLVGGIGIMNTMYMSVMERTKEIGVMKAVGAKNSHIMQIFLIESGIYGLIGGTVGILIGIGIAKAVEFGAASYLGSDLLQAYVSIPLIFGALAFSFVVGAISGIAPSYQASKLHPVEALRYE